MSGRIAAADIATVRDRIRIDEVISEHVTLRPAGGGSLKGLCPFHEERSPGFHGPLPRKAVLLLRLRSGRRRDRLPDGDGPPVLPRSRGETRRPGSGSGASYRGRRRGAWPRSRPTGAGRRREHGRTVLRRAVAGLRGGCRPRLSFSRGASPPTSGSISVSVMHPDRVWSGTFGARV